MGAHSTINISREKARNVLLSKITVANDKELEDYMDALLYDHLYNCRITDEDIEDYVLDNLFSDITTGEVTKEKQSL